MSSPTATVQGLRETLRALRSLPKDGQKELRAEVQRMADRHAEATRSAMRSFPDRRMGLLAESVRARKDRVPTIVVGGAKRMDVSGGGRAGELFFGTEFGSHDWRFGPHNGQQGNAFYPALRRRHPQLVAEYQAVVDRIVDKWGD